MRLPERLFRLVLRLYPHEFRERFGSDMVAAYREARADAAMCGRRGSFEFWTGREAPREAMREALRAASRSR